MGKNVVIKMIAHLLFIVTLAIVIPCQVTAEDAGLTEDGFAYSIVGDIAAITDYKGSATRINVPESVKGVVVGNIGDAAFRDTGNLEEVNIPSGVSRIGDYAFSGCSNLTSLKLPSELISIGYAAFSDCTSLNNVTIPSNVTNIGDLAFRACGNLSSIASNSQL